MGPDVETNEETESVEKLCSFCGNSETEHILVISGPGVYICTDCVQLCNSIMEEKGMPLVDTNTPHHMHHNIGKSDYADKSIQPWEVWDAWDLDPWDADIVKRIARNKEGEDPVLDYHKIKHICDHQIHRIETGVKK